MNCPRCASPSTKEQRQKTILGYRTFRCTVCKHIVLLWRLRGILSLRDIAEMFLERGWTFTHEAVRDWEDRFVPLLADQLQGKRHGQRGEIPVCRCAPLWKFVEDGATCIAQSIKRVIWSIHCWVKNAIWRRPSDFSDRLSLSSAMFPIRSQWMGIPLTHGLYTRTMGDAVQHRTNTYLNNALEQDHRGIKQRC